MQHFSYRFEYSFSSYINVYSRDSVPGCYITSSCTSNTTALENIKKAQDGQKKFYDKGSTVKYDYQKGDLIMTRNLLKTGFPKARWIGPQKILDKNNKEGTSYKIKKTFGNKHETTANIRHMRPYYQESSFLLEGDNVMITNSDKQSSVTSRQDI